MIDEGPGHNLVVVVDTDVVSYSFKGDSRAELYQPHLKGRILIIAAQTRAELELWALQHDWGSRRRAALDLHLRDFVLAPFDQAICLRWAHVTDRARRSGRPILCADAWIGATALRYGVPLVTNNPADYLGVPDLNVISEQG
jgi:tRNA(fMet)-specific endonuclease VapC